MKVIRGMNQIYLLFAIKAALKAGEEIRSVYNDPAANFEVEKKADNSPLTLADRKAHNAICDMLKDTPFPILSEEGAMIPYHIRKEWDSLWIVDPLDGTKEFIKRNGEFTVNIALVQNGVPIQGVIYLPVKHELYFGDAVLGAYKLAAIDQVEEDDTLATLMEKATRLPNADLVDSYVVVASRSHRTPETDAFIEELKRVHANVVLISSGSSIKICLVAEGKAQVYPRFAPTMEWDTAAGDAIARAAGMSVCHIDGATPLCYNKENLLNPWFIVEQK